jgi:hypothetical protein
VKICVDFNTQDWGKDLSGDRMFVWINLDFAPNNSLKDQLVAGLPVVLFDGEGMEADGIVRRGNRFEWVAEVVGDLRDEAG